MVKENTTNRKTNFELMRIISMIFIIIYHVIFHICSIYAYEMSNVMSLTIKFIIAIIIVHVNSFIILSGYFQCEKKMKLSKAISLNNITWFYGVLFLIIAIVLRDYYNFKLTYPITSLDIFKTIIPLDFGNYWFIDIYLLLYLFTPILNKIIRFYDKKGLLKVIIILFILFSIIPTLTYDGVIYTGEGHSIFIFILLYFIGAYIKLHPIDKTHVFDKLSNTAKTNLYFVGFISLAFLSLLFYVMSVQLGKGTDNKIVLFISSVFFNFYNSFGSPIIIIQSLFYFLFFGTLHIKNNIINMISRCVLGIYLIHENIYVRDNLYKVIPFFKTNYFGYKQLAMVFLVAILIFIICLFFETIRKLLTKLFLKPRIIKKMIQMIKNYFNCLGILIE